MSCAVKHDGQIGYSIVAWLERVVYETLSGISHYDTQ